MSNSSPLLTLLHFPPSNRFTLLENGKIPQQIFPKRKAEKKSNQCWGKDDIKIILKTNTRQWEKRWEEKKKNWKIKNNQKDFQLISKLKTWNLKDITHHKHWHTHTTPCTHADRNAFPASLSYVLLTLLSCRSRIQVFRFVFGNLKRDNTATRREQKSFLRVSVWKRKISNLRQRTRREC